MIFLASRLSVLFKCINVVERHVQLLDDWTCNAGRNVMSFLLRSFMCRLPCIVNIASKLLSNSLSFVYYAFS